MKSRSTTLSRLELEYAIPVADAEAMVGLRHGAIIDKVRHLVPLGEITWEIDVFSGDNERLVVAEVELRERGAADRAA